jgi:hypothetical protein
MKRWEYCHVIVHRPDGAPQSQIDQPPPAHVDAILNHYGAEGYCSASNIR